MTSRRWQKVHDDFRKCPLCPYRNKSISVSLQFCNDIYYWSLVIIAELLAFLFLEISKLDLGKINMSFSASQRTHTHTSMFHNQSKHSLNQQIIKMNKYPYTETINERVASSPKEVSYVATSGETLVLITWIRIIAAVVLFTSCGDYFVVISKYLKAKENLTLKKIWMQLQDIGQLWQALY